jgi:DNA polymerase elongation subunit (family B)
MQLQFQITDVHGADTKNGKYAITLFGRTADGQSVMAAVTGFRPRFHVKGNRHSEVFMEDGILPMGATLTEGTYMPYNKFNGFKQMPYTTVTFTNAHDMTHAAGKMASHVSAPVLCETKLPPFLRFFHDHNIQLSGWVGVKDYITMDQDGTDLYVSAPAENYTAVDCNAMAPLRISAFDIETISQVPGKFPVAKDGDIINQICLTTRTLGSTETEKYIAMVGENSGIDGATVESFADERTMLLGFRDALRKCDPDVITGYNIYGFDFKYIYDRCKKLGIERDFSKLSRRGADYSCEFVEDKPYQSKAFGTIMMNYYEIPGRVVFDLQMYCQATCTFGSYKLDDVAAQFIKGKVKGISNNGTCLETTPDALVNVDPGNYIRTSKTEFSTPVRVRVVEVDHAAGTLVLAEPVPDDVTAWSLAKDDFAYSEMYAAQQDLERRTEMARYCIQDGVLCNRIIDKMCIMQSVIAMANVCWVPMAYIFGRGQGIRAFSLVSKKCQELGYIIENAAKVVEEPKYQGAIVLEANPGGYLDPVACNDFASLYPSSMISHNLSPDTLLPMGMNAAALDIPTQEVDCGDGRTFTYVKNEGNVRRGIIPKVLEDLLAQRKRAKRTMAAEKDPYMKSVYDGQQLSYKLVCNSMYGQLGSAFSAIRCKPIAECTTAVGRQMLQYAGRRVRELYPDAHIVYGDTDSIMVRYSIGQEPQAALDHAIECATKVEEVVSGELPYPHKLEFEKVYMPFILYSKKRYSGLMYEAGRESIAGKCHKEDHKGIIMKRRDNAPVVKYIFGKVFNMIVYEKRPIEDIHHFIRGTLRAMVNGRLPRELMILTKKWNPNVKVPPAHAILAQRMCDRAPGNGPNSNDRIKHVYVVPRPSRKRARGDDVEDPDFAAEKGLQLDYLYYIERQIMKPVLELLGLFESADTSRIRMLKERGLGDIDELISSERQGTAYERVFAPIIREISASRMGLRPLSYYQDA